MHSSFPIRFQISVKKNFVSRTCSILNIGRDWFEHGDRVGGGGCGDRGGGVGGGECGDRGGKVGGGGCG